MKTEFQLKKVLLYGAGRAARFALYELSCRYEIVALVDRNPDKNGQVIHGVPVVSPETARELEFDFAVVTLVQYPLCLDEGTGWRGIAPDEVAVLFGIPLERIAYYYGLNEPRAATLSLCAREIHTKKIEGDVAELGVYQGLFAQCVNACFPEKRLYLFDTFSGYDDTEIAANNRRGYTWFRRELFADTDFESVLSRMQNPENCIIREGRFPETAVGLENNTYCFVSIDANLPEPTLAGLEYFVPRMAERGYIFMHDYVWSGSGSIIEATVAAFENSNGISFRRLPLNDGTPVLCF